MSPVSPAVAHGCRTSRTRRAVAEQLGIEFRIVNLMRDYRRLVVDYLLDGYARGLTPNPDVMCNREIKFGVFRAYAKAEGFAGGSPPATTRGGSMAASWLSFAAAKSPSASWA